MNVNVNKGYKAYKKGLICEPDSEHRKQYAENTVFEEEGGKICGAGLMHYCLNPLDTLDYYPLIDSDGNMSEFTEIEALEQPVTDDGEKYAARKLKIGVKLSLPAFIKASFNFLWERSYIDEPDSRVTAASGYCSKLAASGYNSQLAASGDNSKLAASGYNSQLAASGDNSKLAASGDNSKLAASGYNSKLVASGNNSKLAASGNDSQLAASGDNSKLAASGDNSIAAGIGINNIAKASKGSWIVLAEWKYDKKKNTYIPVCVKSVQIDGEKIKEDTFYRLKNGEFVEV